eukprot:246447-Prorocentrum_minimum.AAC.1
MLLPRMCELGTDTTSWSKVRMRVEKKPTSCGKQHVQPARNPDESCQAPPASRARSPTLGLHCKRSRREQPLRPRLRARALRRSSQKEGASETVLGWGSSVSSRWASI